MALNPAVRVGIIVFIALIALAAVAYFLTDYRLSVTGYQITGIYDSVYGLTPGSEVRMAGVTIGRVDAVTLDANQRAVVTMRIDPRVSIPEGSQFILRLGLLIGDRYIDIIPNRDTDRFMQAGDTVMGEVPPRIEDLLPAAQELIANLTDVSESLKDIVGDEEYQASIKRSLTNIEQATARLDRTMFLVERTVAGQQDEVGTIVSNVLIASESLRNLTADLERMVADVDVQEDISATLAAAREATESLARTTTSLEALVTEPGFQEDIRTAVAQARETVEEAREIVARVGRLVGTRPGEGPGLPRIPTRDTGLETLVRAEDGRVRTTLSTTIPLLGPHFLRLGIYDIGAGNRLILQPGQSLNERTDLRYGIYASRLGVGVDHAFGERVYGTANLYDPYDPRLDIHAGYRLTDNLGLLLGVDNVFDDNQLTLGVRLTR